MTIYWRIAQALSVVVALCVTALLVFQAELGLFITWNILIPLVPASLLIAPQMWRNLCPIAVVNQVPFRRSWGGSIRLPAQVQRRAPVVAAALFYAIVPLRLAVFNDNGPALAAFVVGVLVLAALGGLMVTGKGGWCATICPVLPVERLYGQKPIVGLPHAHCETCTGCIRSCYDLDPEGSMDELVRSSSGARGVLRRSTGLFAAAFPGFVFGYFTAQVGEGNSLPFVYLWIVGHAATSALLVAFVQLVTRTSDRMAIRVSAAAAAGLYYWFAVPSVFAEAHRVIAAPAPSTALIAVVQFVFLTLAAYWLIAGIWRTTATPSLSR